MIFNIKDIISKNYRPLIRKKQEEEINKEITDEELGLKLLTIMNNLNVEEVMVNKEDLQRMSDYLGYRSLSEFLDKLIEENVTINELVLLFQDSDLTLFKYRKTSNILILDEDGEMPF